MMVDSYYLILDVPGGFVRYVRMDSVPHIYASKLNGTVHIYSVAYYCRDAIA